MSSLKPLQSGATYFDEFHNETVDGISKCEPCLDGYLSIAIHEEDACVRLCAISDDQSSLRKSLLHAPRASISLSIWMSCLSSFHQSKDKTDPSES